MEFARMIPTTGEKERDIVQQAKSLLYEQALVGLDDRFFGTLAAIPKKTSEGKEDLNYNRNGLFSPRWQS
jgi:hypothetical protein